MRSFAAAFILIALAACTEVAPDGEPEAAPAALYTGGYKPASDNAHTLTGGVSVQPGGLMFDGGAVLYTRTLEPRAGADAIAPSGDTYAAIALGPAEMEIELRRVIDMSQTTPLRACGAARPTYVALAYSERATRLAVLIFSGDEPPGPHASDSALCGVFAYAALSGARTRQGIVPW